MKFELRTDPQPDGTEGWNEDCWGVVNTDTNEVILYGNYDDHGWAGKELFERFSRVLNQLHEHPEDF